MLILELQGFMQHNTFFNSNGPYVTKLNNFNVYAKHFACIVLLAELSSAERAGGAPWVRKFGKLSIREDLVMT